MVVRKTLFLPSGRRAKLVIFDERHGLLSLEKSDIVLKASNKRALQNLVEMATGLRVVWPS